MNQYANKVSNWVSGGTVTAVSQMSLLTDSIFWSFVSFMCSAVICCWQSDQDVADVGLFLFLTTPPEVTEHLNYYDSQVIVSHNGGGFFFFKTANDKSLCKTFLFFCVGCELPPKHLLCFQTGLSSTCQPSAMLHQRSDAASTTALFFFSLSSELLLPFT